MPRRWIPALVTGSGVIGLPLEQYETEFFHRTILEKLAGPGRRKYEIITILVGARSILMQYLGIDGRLHLQTIPTPIPPNKWCHLAIQVYQNQITVYVDEVEDNADAETELGTPIFTDQLVFPILDINDEPIVRMGHRVRGQWGAEYLA